MPVEGRHWRCLVQRPGPLLAVVHFPPQTLILFGRHSHPPLVIVWLANPNLDADVGSLRGPRRRRGVVEMLEKLVSPHIFVVL